MISCLICLKEFICLFNVFRMFTLISTLFRLNITVGTCTFTYLFFQTVRSQLRPWLHERFCRFVDDFKKSRAKSRPSYRGLKVINAKVLSGIMFVFNFHL